jgi:hypothetical protein
MVTAWCLAPLGPLGAGVPASWTAGAGSSVVGTAETHEVQVLEAQVPPGQGERYAVLYRMEVLSVLRASPSRMEPGDTIAVRAASTPCDPG